MSPDVKLSSSRVQVEDSIEAVSEYLLSKQLSDGLPVVPPTEARVRAFVEYTRKDPKQKIAVVAPMNGEATVEKVAVNAVMAGCKKEYMPVLLAAVSAMAEPQFNLNGMQATTNPIAVLVIINGPIRDELNVNYKSGLFGPGWQANATIGRAVRLVMNNLGGGWPGAVSLAGLGQPARYTLCFAERDDSPWPGLHRELGFGPERSTVTVLRSETVINVTGGLAELASVMGSAASLFTMLHNGKVAVVLAPFVAQRLAREGWSKDDVRRALHERGRLPAETWRHSWLHATVRGSDWPAWVRAAAEGDSIPALREPADITVVVAGADLEIPQNAYFPSWGHPPCRITREVALPDDWAGRLAEPAG